jgi:hypothetical protein
LVVARDRVVSRLPVAASMMRGSEAVSTVQIPNARIWKKVQIAESGAAKKKKVIARA